jgi:hypothetical protein
MRNLICILFLALFSAAAFAREPIEDQKIEFLIASVADLHDATFIRNGSEYDAQHAADHMRLKLRYAGNRVGTAEEFITCCATGSSMSGQPYTIKFADGHIVPSADFLHMRLLEFKAPEPASASTHDATRDAIH